MRLVLRQKDSGLFWEAPNMWTADPELAFDFRFRDRALEYAERYGLGEVELVFVWESPPMVKGVPVETAIPQMAA